MNMSAAVNVCIRIYVHTRAMGVRMHVVDGLDWAVSAHKNENDHGLYDHAYNTMAGDIISTPMVLSSSDGVSSIALHY